MRDCYQVKCGQLANGLRFYTKYDSDTTKETVIIAVMAGSIHDPPSGNRLAHLIEHELTTLLDRDQKFLSFALRTFGSRYPPLDFETGLSAVVYGYKTPIRKKDNRTLLSFLAEIVINPDFSEIIHNSQKAVIHQEYYQKKQDVIEEVLETWLYKTIYPRSPIYRSVYEHIRNSKKITLDEARDYWKKFYVPANTFVVFFGPKFNEVRDLLNESPLGQWQTDDGRNKPYGLPAGKSGRYRGLGKSKRKIISHPGTHQYCAAIGIPAPLCLNGDVEGLNVLENILVDRLYARLRLDNQQWERGVYTPSAVSAWTKFRGVLGFTMSSLSKEWIDHSINVFEEECQELAVNLIGREELSSRVAYLQKEFKQMLINADADLIDEIIEAVSGGDVELEQFHERGERLAKFLKRGGRQRLRDIAKKYLLGNKAIVILKPK